MCFRGQKKASDPLGLELQGVMSHLVRVLGTGLRFIYLTFKGTILLFSFNYLLHIFMCVCAHTNVP